MRVEEGDITTYSTDAIVNAANAALSGGGGVDGAIHRAAGPGLLAACRKLKRCPPGDAVITPGFNLPARFVIHAVGPVWRGGNAGEAEQLARCYRRSIELARQANLESIAFPAISCGVYRYPLREAAKSAMQTLKSCEEEEGELEVYMVCFEAAVKKAFIEAHEAVR